jgi:hypothetical protein
MLPDDEPNECIIFKLLIELLPHTILLLLDIGTIGSLTASCQQIKSIMTELEFGVSICKHVELSRRMGIKNRRGKIECVCIRCVYIFTKDCSSNFSKSREEKDRA